jgi:hypothetical protein
MSLFATSTQPAHLFDIPSDKPKDYNFPHQFLNTQNPLETASRFLDDLKRVTNELTLRSKPDGSRLHPARSCRDIADYYPGKSNGLIHISFFI